MNSPQKANKKLELILKSYSLRLPLFKTAQFRRYTSEKETT